MQWPWEMVERDHVIQDPTSPEKIRLLGEYLRLTADSQVLDMGCGKAGPAVVLAEAFGCRILGVELREGVDREPFVSLPETVARFESAGVRLTGIIAADQDDWDRYESLHWRAVEEWLAANQGHPDAAAIRDRHRASLAAYLEHLRP